MRTLLIALSTLVASASFAQQEQKKLVSIPCRVAAEEVTFLYDPNDQAIPGQVVSIAKLKKTEARPSFDALSAKDRQRLQRQARRAHACEIFVINAYKRPACAPHVTAEQEARLQEEIWFYMVQRVRPCPECPAAQN